MENNNDIGRAFRERLKDLDKTPSDRVWTAIETDMQEKKKRRVAFWLWLPAVLLPLLAGVYFGTDVWSGSEDTSTPAVNIDAYAPGNTGRNGDATVNQQHPEASGHDAGTARNADAVLEKGNENQNAVTKGSRKTKIASGNASKSKHASGNKKRNAARNANVYYKQHFSQKKAASKQAAFGDVEKQDNSITYAPDLTGGIGKELMFAVESDSLAALAEVKKDSTKVKKLPETDDKTLEQPKPQYEFRLGAWYGPNRFASFSPGSLLSNGDEYSSEAQWGQSFGVYGTWKANAKLGIRIGYSQSTFNSRTSVKGRGGDATFFDFNRIALRDGLTVADVDAYFAAAVDTIAIDQEIRYTELPITFSYTIRDQRFGIDVLAGMTLMRLSGNTLVVSAEGIAPLAIGKQKDFMKMTTGIDAGFQVYYKFGTRWRIEAAPVFRYQIKALESDTKFRPWSFTTQIGFSYRL